MSSHSTAEQTQPQILRTYTALLQLRPTWGGQLILSLGLNPAGAALSIAANIAGAVSLAIGNHPTHIRDVVRSGACDFVVTTLDEAIRAMKNEVRKHAPLSVALNADPVSTLKEILERGLSPQLFSNFLTPFDLTSEQFVTLTHAAERFQSQGTSLIDFSGEAHPQPTPFTPSETLLTPLLNERQWSIYTLPFDTPADLRAFDAKALTLLSPDDPDDALRRRWLEAAPRILRRQVPPQRSLWLTESEFSVVSFGQR
jgi:urocanate hydratase